MVHPKLSRWLSISENLLNSRISSSISNQFSEELELRRALVANSDVLYPSVDTNSIQGAYQIIGANSENSEQGYFGVLTLVEADNRIYATWLIEGEDTQTGFGLLLNNILSIHFVYEQDGKDYVGIVTYEFITNNVLSGNWVEEGTNTIGVEFARKLPIQREDPLGYFGFN